MPDVAIPSPERPRQIDYDCLPGFLGYVLRNTQTWVFDDFKAHIGTLGVSPGEFGLLTLIKANDGLTQNELAAAVGLNKSTLTPALQRLEQKGLVERRPIRQDRRYNTLTLSKAGAALYPELLSRVEAHDRSVTANLSDGERSDLLRLLGKLRA